MEEDWNDGYQLEALDRLHIAMCMISDHIEEHPAVIKAKAQKKVGKAMGLLMDAYQKVGELESQTENKLDSIKVFAKTLSILGQTERERLVAKDILKILED